MSQSRTFKGLLTMALLAFALSLQVTTPAPASAAGFSFQNVSYNICGSGKNTSCLSFDGTKSDVIAAQIAKYTPYFVALQEVCDGQLNDIRVRAANKGFQMYSYFFRNASVNTAQCTGFGGTGGYGVGVLVRRAASTPQPLNTIYREQGTEQRSHGCVYGLISTAQPRVCSTHLDANRTVAGYQEIQAGMDLRNGDTRQIFMSGDFNLADRSLMAEMYGAGYEADAVNTDPNDIANSPTLGSEKIDYSFWGKLHFYAQYGARSVDVRTAGGSRVSDHNMLVAYEEI